MQMKVEKKAINNIETCNIVQQTSFWANVKYQQGMKPLAFKYIASEDLLHPSFRRGKTIRDDMLVLVKYIDDVHCFAYVPYGPVDEPEAENQGVFLEELSETLRFFLPGNCILIRYDLPWENQWALEEDFFDAYGQWTGPPSSKNQEFRVNFKTKNWNLVKSHTDHLPSNTIFLNLNQSKENLINRMKPKTRYNIRLSFRKGIRVKSYGVDKLETWYSLYRETARRNNIRLHEKDYFYSVLEKEKKQSSGDVATHLLMADYEGEYLGAMVLVLSRKRGVYLYGASSGRRRHLMASYALQWEAIRMAQQAGCEEYDMFGAAPNGNSGHPLHGLYRFKSGFGGSFFHRMGCWDYPLDPEKYKLLRAKEVNDQNYHLRN